MLLAALRTALKVVGKEMGKVHIAMIGMGAANVPSYRFLKASGAVPASIQPAIWAECWDVIGETRKQTPPTPNRGESVWKPIPPACRAGIAEALRGTDICVAFSAGGIIKPEWIYERAKAAAQEQGVAQLRKSPAELHRSAEEKIKEARTALADLTSAGVIVPPPPSGS